MWMPRLLGTFVTLSLLGACGDPAAGLLIAAGPPAPAPGPAQRLSETGLYADLRAGTLAAGVRPFTPRFALWSDGEQKSRYLYLPPGARIDVTDMDHWSFPVGTRLWKEFRRGDARIETRMIERTGPGPDDFTFSAYAWSADGSDAVLVPQGMAGVGGTDHDIPARGLCRSCHGHLPERVLGVGAIQLDHPGAGEVPGLTLAQLQREGLLSRAPAPAEVALPGDETAQAALGYLHANCSHCHNPHGIPFRTPFSLRLFTGRARVEDTDAYRTAVGVVPAQFAHPGISARIAPGSPHSSAIHYRMSQRGNGDQMPPLGTHHQDQQALDAVAGWIASLN